jgi:inosose dehydratase
LMANSGEALPLLFDAGHMAFAGGDVMRVIDKHHKRISHVHTKDVRMGVIDKLDRKRESFLDAVVKGAFTVPGDGSLDFAAIIKRLASYGYEGWFVVEAEQDPKVSPPLRKATRSFCALELFFAFLPIVQGRSALTNAHPRLCIYYFMTKSAPERMPVGHRVVIVLSFV